MLVSFSEIATELARGLVLPESQAMDAKLVCRRRVCDGKMFRSSEIRRHVTHCHSR